MRAIVTPTYKGHFKFIDKYLDSFKQFVTDKNEVTILFTISKSEEEEFKKVTNKYKDFIRFKILFFEDILKKFNVNLTPDEILKKYNKFTFQTLKKFYTMLYCDFEQYLVLDSESMWINKTSIKEMFESFFDSPFISGGNIDSFKKYDKNFKPYYLCKCILDNSNFVLNSDVNIYFLENFVWYYDKSILNDLFNRYGSLSEILEKVYNSSSERKVNPDLFEIQLYQQFIYLNKEKYNYKYIDTGKLLEENLSSDETVEYIKKHNELYSGNPSYFEYVANLINENNCEKLAACLKNNKFNIIRIISSNFNNFELQEKFINTLQPNILAASQEHIFGINDKYNYLFNSLNINLKYDIYKTKLHYSKNLFEKLKDRINLIRCKNELNKTEKKLSKLKNDIEKTNYLKEAAKKYPKITQGECLKIINYKKRIKKLEKEYKNKKIIIYGAGKLFQIVNSDYDLSKLNIIGISDKRFDNSEAKEFLSYKIVPTYNLKNESMDVVVVTALEYEYIISDLKNTIDGKIEIVPLLDNLTKQILLKL